MAEIEKRLAQAFKVLMKDGPAGPHPSADDLVAYSASELGPEEESRLQLHLAHCGECSRAALDMSVFPDLEPRPGEPPLSTAEAAEDKRRIQQRIWDRGRQRRGERWLRPVAAVLLLAVVGLSGWVMQLQSQIGSGRTVPVANVAVQVLEPLGSSITRGVSPAQETPVVRSSREAVLALSAPADADFPAFEAEIWNQAGRLAWNGQVDRLPENIFTIQVSPTSLPAGVYEIRLYGLRDGERIGAATYKAELRYER